MIARAIERARAAGRPLIDLTSGNPTTNDLGDRRDDVRALGDPAGSVYAPDAQGMLSAREAIARYYRERGRPVAPEDVLVTASTSEAYGWLFKLLCNPGDAVLSPQPSYPLFPYIADLEHVELVPYPLLRAERWRVDTGAMKRTLAERDDVRAILLVHPGNPTGTFIHRDDMASLIAIAGEHELALIVDEVFLDYATGGTSFAGGDEVNTFVLSGLSKVALLPQVKLAWLVVSGPDAAEAQARLEIIGDTYLSVSTAAQLACSELLDRAPAAQHAVHIRIRDNLAVADAVLALHDGLRRIPSDGGWYACIEVPRTRSDDAWCAHLIESERIIVHPGHFFDMQERGVMVVSLLSPDFADAFARAAERWARC